MVGLPESERNFEDMCNRLDRIPACDRQTGGQTSCQGMVRAVHTHRAVKIEVSPRQPLGTPILKRN